MLIPISTPSFNVETSLSFIESAFASPGTATHTFTDVDFGGPAPHRHIVVAMSYLNTGSYSPDTAAVTIGGYTATKLASGANVGLYTGLFAAKVPTGSTGSIFIAPSTTLHSVGIGVFRLIHQTGTPNDTDSNATGANLSIDTTAGGVLIATSMNINGGATVWTNATEQYDEDIRTSDNHSGAMVTSTTATTLSVASSTAARIAGASWS